MNDMSKTTTFNAPERVTAHSIEEINEKLREAEIAAANPNTKWFSADEVLERSRRLLDDV